MQNIISETGFWISNSTDEHRTSLELSEAINSYVVENSISTVYDFGCGTGEYLQLLTEANDSVIATGFDGYQTDGLFKNIIAKDLSEPVKLDPADLVISIEVGEHIPKKYEQNFIDNLSNNSSKHMIVSWAIVGQGGLGHINCQNNDYIIDQFVERGWNPNIELSRQIRDSINDPICQYLKNTILVFTK